MAKRWHILRTRAGDEPGVVRSIVLGRYDAARIGRRMVLPGGLSVGDRVSAAVRQVSPVKAWAPEYEKQVFRRRVNGGGAARRIVTERRRLFPGYVFARFDHLADAWGWLLGVPRRTPWGRDSFEGGSTPAIVLSGPKSSSPSCSATCSGPDDVDLAFEDHPGVGYSLGVL